jgi:hypothetical protein
VAVRGGNRGANHGQRGPLKGGQRRHCMGPLVESLILSRTYERKLSEIFLKMKEKL